MHNRRNQLYFCVDDLTRYLGDLLRLLHSLNNGLGETLAYHCALCCFDLLVKRLKDPGA